MHDYYIKINNFLITIILSVIKLLWWENCLFFFKFCLFGLLICFCCLGALLINWLSGGIPGDTKMNLQIQAYHAQIQVGPQKISDVTTKERKKKTHN